MPKAKPRLLINNFPFGSAVLKRASDLIEHTNHSGGDAELCIRYVVEYPTSLMMEHLLAHREEIYDALTRPFVRLTWMDAEGNVTPADYDTLDAKQRENAIKVWDAHSGITENAEYYSQFRERIMGIHKDLEAAGKPTTSAQVLAMYRDGEIVDRFDTTYPMAGLQFSDTARDKALELLTAKKRFEWKGRYF